MGDSGLPAAIGAIIGGAVAGAIVFGGLVLIMVTLLLK